MTINPFEGPCARARRARRIGLKVSLVSIVLSGLFMFLSAAKLAAKQDSAAPAPTTPIETTVCDILNNPTAFNNKLVRIRGLASVSPEYSMIEGYGCSDAIWLAYGDGSGPPGLIATTPGRTVPGGTDSQGARVTPIRVKLVADSNFKKFQKLLAAAAKAEEQYESSDSDDVVRYGVIATFVGRLDSVSPEIHAAHLKRSPNEKPDWKGFGQMGMFDAQLVLQSVQGPLEMDAIHYH